MLWAVINWRVLINCLSLRHLILRLLRLRNLRSLIVLKIPLQCILLTITYLMLHHLLLLCIESRLLNWRHKLWTYILLDKILLLILSYSLSMLHLFF